MMSDPEHILSGGNVAASVVRVGTTVRKPTTAASPHVAAFLTFLHEQGFPSSPRHLGTDDQGRQILEYIPGTICTAEAPLSLSDLEAIGRLIRQVHDASALYPIPAAACWDVAIPPDRGEILCHNDLAPWNLVRTPDRWVFIDWDAAGPGSRFWDLA